MLFNSLIFFALLLPTLVLYWASSSQQFRLLLLVAASLLFYGFDHWASVFLLLFTVPFNFFIGRAQRPGRSKMLLVLAVAINLSLLCWFKYVVFIAEYVNVLLSFFGTTLSAPHPTGFLPLGISFSTFQVVAYQIDVYRGEIQAETSLLRFAVFKCFFPQLIAGPIVRAKEFLPQLYERRKFDAATFHQGLWLVIAGLFLKIGVADILAQFANEAFRTPSNLTTIGAWTGLYAYGFQLFADFWGYSTMAMGLAALFGFALPLNFDTPYFSTSLQEFWRRWHITLSFWFRDYVYIPLGGSRQRRNVNLLVTMLLVGLWHGTGWTFMIWGVAHGLWLCVERSLPSSDKMNDPVSRAVKTFLVFNGVCLLWVLFRAPTFSVAMEYFSRLLLPPFTFSKIPPVLLWWLIVFAVAHRPLAWSLKEYRFAQFPLKLQWTLALACLYFILVYAGAKVDFIYFSF